MALNYIIIQLLLLLKVASFLELPQHGSIYISYIDNPLRTICVLGVSPNPLLVLHGHLLFLAMNL